MKSYRFEIKDRSENILQSILILSNDLQTSGKKARLYYRFNKPIDSFSLNYVGIYVF